MKLSNLQIFGILFFGALIAEYIAICILLLVAGGIDNFMRVPLSEFEDVKSFFWGGITIALFTAAIGNCYKTMLGKISTTMVISASIVISLLFQMVASSSC